MEFKHAKDRDNMLFLHPALIMIYADLFWYTKDNHNIDLVVTDTISTIEVDRKLKRVSKAHQRALAIDIRTRDIPNHIVEDITRYINTKSSYGKYKYMSSSGVYRLAYWHNNSNGDHIHLAIHSRYKDFNL